jgi:DNA-binding transcriptional LysR family regulator
MFGMLEQIRSFLTIVEEGSLHRAARIAYLVSVTQQYLNGALRKVRRSHPETVLKLVNLTPGEQIVALRGGEIDIGITNDIRVVSKTDTI